MRPQQLALHAVVLLALAALAGCVSEPLADPPVTTPPVPELLPGLPEGVLDPMLVHSMADHGDPTKHKLAFNMTLLSHHALGGSVARSSGAHAVDVRGDWLFVATYGSVVDIQGGLWIFSLKEDPTKPRLVGQFPLPGNLGGDRSMEATDDGNFVVLGTEAIDCAGHVNPFAPGLYLIDTRDKALPKLADYKFKTGVHSVTVHKIGGKDHVFILGGSPNILSIDAAAGRFIEVGSFPIKHDSSVFDDPILGKPLLLVSNGDGPLTIYDVSEPSAPKKVGQWTSENRGSESRYYHQAVAMVQEGRRIVIMDSEDWGTNPSPVYFLDATNLDDIQLISTWTNPGGHPANAHADGRSLAFSTHNPRVENGTVALAHYHGGVWLLNVSTEAKLRVPQIEGYYLPHEDIGIRPQSSHGAYPFPNACGFALTEIPNVFDVEYHRGIMYAADLHTGLYVLKAS
jgi:hypothetical protein